MGCFGFSRFQVSGTVLDFSKFPGFDRVENSKIAQNPTGRRLGDSAGFAGFAGFAGLCNFCGFRGGCWAGGIVGVVWGGVGLLYISMYLPVPFSRGTRGEKRG